MEGYVLFDRCLLLYNGKENSIFFYLFPSERFDIAPFEASIATENECISYFFLTFIFEM
jgi:hypothetical protein